MKNLFKFLLFSCFSISMFCMASEQSSMLRKKRSRADEILPLRNVRQRSDVSLSEHATALINLPQSLTAESADAEDPYRTDSDSSDVSAKKHKCTHLGCNYATTQSGNLKRHMLSHTGEKPHACTHPGCNYALLNLAI